MIRSHDQAAATQRSGKAATKRHIGLQLCLVLVAGSFLAPSAHAGFVGPYDLSNFVLLNTNADGSPNTLDGGLSVNLTGGNNGSGLQGTTDLTIAAAAAGTVHFQYSYFSNDDAGFDLAGYLLSGAFTQLTDTSGTSGTVNFAVAAGQVFGFRVLTVDNQFEPGILTISDFNGPVAGSSGPGVPEPSEWSLTLIGGVALFTTRFLLKRSAPIVEVRR